MFGKRKHHPISIVLLALLPLFANADTREIWECNTGLIWSAKKEHNLWLVEDGANSYVKFYDTRIPSHYRLLGLDRTWFWIGYNINLKSTDIAYYFNRTDTADKNGMIYSKQTFGCKKIRSR